MKDTTTTAFGDVLSTAINNKKNDLSLLAWKGKDGREVRLLDMPIDDLQRVYEHATDMLWNKSRWTPGKAVMKDNIKRLIEHCNAELLKRYIIYDCDIAIMKTPIQIVQFLRDKKKELSLKDTDSVSTIFTHLPNEFTNVSIDLLLSACLDTLDVINRKMISEQFILSQGIWLTDEEKTDLTEYDENNQMRPWMEVIKERLVLDNVKLRVDPKGFSYAEFRNLVHLAPMPRISSLTKDTLALLRDKVFLLLDADTDYHIKKWEEIISNIEKVAEYKHITLTKKTY